MSFFRITDPKKRDAMVADYTATMKRLRERNFEERLGSLAHQRELTKAVNPIIESNKEATTVITNELKPIKEEMVELNKYMREEKRFPTRGRKVTDEPIVGLTGFLEGDHSRQDLYYGIQRNKDNQFVLGDKEVEIDKDNNIHVDGDVYPGTRGLWSLVMDISPKSYTDEDYENYKKLVLQTDLINNPKGVQVNSRPKQTNKYKNYLVKIAEEYQMKSDDDYEDETKGKGIQFLPSTIKELFEKLKLLAAEFVAGNTTTRNELVAVLDQLLQRNSITEKEYTAINTLLSQ